MPSLSPFDNHPFSLSSIPTADTMLEGTKVEGDSEPNAMTFLIRSHAGFTNRLTSYVSKDSDKTFKAWIDGPYGGVHMRIENIYNSVMLISGGVGASTSVPWVSFLANKMRQ